MRSIFHYDTGNFSNHYDCDILFSGQYMSNSIVVRYHAQRYLYECATVIREPLLLSSQGRKRDQDLEELH